MLQKVSELVRNCHERAAAAKQRAEAAKDAAAKADFLDMEKCWLSLADHCAFAESLSAQKLDERAQTDAGADASRRLQEISTLLIQEGNLDALYERVLDAATSLMSADMGSIQKYDPERDQLRLLASRGFIPESVAVWEQVNRHS